jgi:hypothetical protein
LKTNTVILFAALALLSAGAFADPAQQDKLLYKFLEKGIDNPFVTGTSFCHLNRVYHADYDPLANTGSQGDPLHPNLADYPAYEQIFTFDKFLEEHMDHGDVVSPDFGVDGNSAALNPNGLAVTNEWGAVGIHNMWINEECEIADPCTLERQSACLASGYARCLAGQTACGAAVTPPTPPPLPPGGGR